MPQRSNGSASVHVHGVNVQVENPENTHSIRRRGSGTTIHQAEGANWFHFALPAETLFVESGERFPHGHELKSVSIRAELNNAVITDVHVWEEDERLKRFPGSGDGDYGLDLRGPEVFESFDLEDRNLGTRSSGLAVCIRVAFLDGEPMGSVRFISAGARIFHKYHP